MKQKLIILLLIFSIGCSNEKNQISDNPFSELIVELNPITVITYNSIEVNAFIENNDDVPIYEAGFCWSTIQNPTIEDSTFNPELTSDSFSSTIDQLEPNTNYFIRAYVSSTRGLIYSNEYNITTKAIVRVCEDTYRYVNNSRENAKSVVKTSDGGFVVVASYTEYCNCIPDTDAILLKYNSNCELVWEMDLADPNTSVHPNKIIEDSDNNLLVSSSYFGQNGSKSMISKFNLSGTLIWETIVDENLSNDEEKYGNQSLIETLDGNYAMAGNWNPDYFSDTYPDSDFSLIKISRNGELLSKNHFGYVDYIEHAWDFIEHPNGDLMFIGQTGLNWDHTGTSTPTQPDMKLVKLNSEGEFLWEKVYERYGKDYPRTVISTSDGNLVVSGWSDGSNIGHFDISLVKLDWDGNIIWENAIGKINHLIEIIGPNSIIETQDNNLVIAAQISDEWEPCSFCGSSETDVFVVKTDSNGNMIWNNTISSLETRSYDGAQSVIELDNGEIVLVGHKEDELNSVLDATHSDIWIIKIREND